MPSILFYFSPVDFKCLWFCHIQEGQWFQPQNQKGMVINLNGLEVSCYYSVKNSALVCL